MVCVRWQLNFTALKLFRNKWMYLPQNKSIFYFILFFYLNETQDFSCMCTKICTKQTKKMYQQVFKQPYKPGFCYISCSERQTFKHQQETVLLQSSRQLRWNHRRNIRCKLLICKDANWPFGLPRFLLPTHHSSTERASACPHAAPLWETHAGNGRGYT